MSVILSIVNVVLKLPMVRYLLEGVLKRNEVSIGRYECSDLKYIS